MIDLNKKKKKRSFIYSPLAVIVLLLILGFFISSIWDFYSKATESANRREITDNEYQELQDRKISLETELERLNSQVGQEEELRTRFSRSKEGERLVVIVDEVEDVISATSSDQTAGLWGFFKRLFD